jgi:hypothetical protein
MTLSHSKLIIISGLIWFGIGLYLLQLGLNLLIGIDAAHSYPLIEWMRSYFGSLESAAVALLALALFIGYFKGRYVLGKTALKGIKRISSFPNPAKISQIYQPKYYLLIGCMICLGISMKFFGVSNDIRGFVDTAVGSALINGALVYFRNTQTAKNASHL